MGCDAQGDCWVPLGIQRTDANLGQQRSKENLKPQTGQRTTAEIAEKFVLLGKKQLSLGEWLISRDGRLPARAMLP
jgi:hypothetical protein